MKPRKWMLVVCSLAVLALTIGLTLTPTAEAQTYNVIHNFTGGSDGANPIAGLTVDAAGSLYGTASVGGGWGVGTVYRLVHSGSSWTLYTLYYFKGLTRTTQDGGLPYSRAVMGPNGVLYGTTHNGGAGEECNQLHGCGVIYSLEPRAGNMLAPWEETVLYAFGGNNGANPDYGDVVFDHAGNLYGTTRNGGTYGQGAVYELTSGGGSWTEAVLHSFTGLPDGGTPLNGPVFDQAGNLYGTTNAGGANGWGTVYRMTFSASVWTENILHSFQNGSDGQGPAGNLVFDPSGNLYGATEMGGTGRGGTVFKLTPSTDGSWNLSALYGFIGTGSGGSYRTVVMDSAGNLYGTSSGDGVNQWGSVFKLTRSGSGWIYSSLHDFTGGADGGMPFGSVAFDAMGNLYGTASVGGAYGDGVVFEITQ
jgi:uncharacterized repeat protein (TIGR03803 family)